MKSQILRIEELKRMVQKAIVVCVNKLYFCNTEKENIRTSGRLEEI
jgi:hypothetical protein